MKRLEKAQAFGKTLTLKVKFQDFTQITRSHTQLDEIRTYDQLVELSFQLLENIQWSNFPEGVRLLGITCSNFGGEKSEESSPGMQLTLDF